MSILPQGPWAPRKIANPDHFLDESPLQNLGSIGGVAIEIWTMDEGYLFDNVLIANDASDAEEKRTSLWAPKKEAEVRSSQCLKAQQGRQSFMQQSYCRNVEFLCKLFSCVDVNLKL